MTTDSILDSLQVRWATAVRAAESAGLQVKENVQSCCGSCVDVKTLGMDEEKPYAWTPGYQGSAYEWQDPNSPIHFEDEEAEEFDGDDEDGDTVWRETGNREYTSPVEYVYWHHSSGGAELVVKAFRDHGFKAEWDGSEYQCVKVFMR